ncbi:MAG: AI-2E family transporter [Patescibacteria group bacterium]|nr:AI-2E family transporter [Patescibacteria group bacterium]
MLEELKKQFSSVQILVSLLIVAVGIYIFQALSQVLGNFSDVIVMLISAWLLGFILEPAVDTTAKFIKSKVWAALLVYALSLAVLGITIFLFVPQISSQLQALFVVLPKYLSNYPGFMKKWGDFVNTSLSSSIVLLPSVANFFLYAFIALIISFYLIVDKERINTEVYNLLPRNWHKEARFVQNVIDSTFASFLRVQLVFCFLAGISTWIILRVLNIDYAASTAVISGVLTIVPLIGPVLAFIPPVAVAAIIDPTRAIIVAIAILVVQQIIFNVIGPRMMGKAFKMHPIIVLLSFLVGYKIAGGAGAVFAIPVLGILIVVIHRLSRHFINPEEK